MSKQSSIEWLIEQVKKEHPFWTDTFEQAKAMHKEEIEEAYGHGSNNGYMYAMEKSIIISREQYYEQTFRDEEVL